jgi:hypothetical protein
VQGTYRRGLDGLYSGEINGVLLRRPFPETGREREKIAGGGR